jgi:chemotaxis response regulator CheB
VRILLAGMSNMLAAIVTAVLTQLPDTIVAGAIGEGEDIVTRIRRTRSDVVVIEASEPGNPNEFAPLLRKFPGLKVVAIASGTNNGFLHELRLHSLLLPELSAEVLQTALRPAPTRQVH